MKKTLFFMLALCALCAFAGRDLNADLQKMITPKLTLIKNYAKQNPEAKGEVLDDISGKKAFRVTSTAQSLTHFYTPNTYAAKGGETLMFKVTAFGTGKMIAGYYAYGKRMMKNPKTGKTETVETYIASGAKSFAVAADPRDYRFGLTLQNPKGCEITSVRLVLGADKDSSATFRSISVEANAPAAKK